MPYTERLLQAARATAYFLRNQLNTSRAALLEICEEHRDGGPAHHYVTGEDMPHHCITCGDSELYPVEWPCRSWTTANTALKKSTITGRNTK